MLRHFLRKLVIGTVAPRENIKNRAVAKRIANIKAVWNNTHHNDSGIEKLFRLFLALSQFIFPGIYVKDLFNRFGFVYQELVTEGFVLFKVALPIILLYTGWFHSNVALYIMIWLMAETLLYIPTIIFVGDNADSTRGFRRSMIMLFLNYLEIVFSFAVLYYRGQYFNQPMSEPFDAIYFSFITSNTIGYGDFYPIVKMGKLLVTLQSMFYLSFIILFINFFSQRAKK